jgi:Osmosensitive K+ channel histidine kinase
MEPNRVPSHEDIMTLFAHDLRTPLTAIRSFSEILLDNPDLPGSERDRFLAIVLEESARLHRCIERVLEVAARESCGAVAAMTCPV